MHSSGRELRPIGGCLPPVVDGAREDCGSFPVTPRAGNSCRTFGLLCDVARGVK